MLPQPRAREDRHLPVTARFPLSLGACVTSFGASGPDTLSHTFPSASLSHTPSLLPRSNQVAALRESGIHNCITPVLGLAVFTTLLRHS